MFILEIFIIILQFIVYSFYFKKKINYMSFFNSIWLLAIFLSRFGFLGTKIPSTNTYCYLYFMLVCFNLSSILFLKARATKNRINLSNCQYSEINGSPEKINTNIIVLLFVIFAFLVLIPKIPNAINLYQSGGFNRIRSNFLNADSDNFTGGIFITGFVNAIIISSFYLSIISILKGIKGKQLRTAILIVIIDIINLLMYMFITGGRFLLVICMLAICLSIWLNSSGKIINIVKKYKKALIVITFCIAILIFISSKRVLSGLNLFGNIYVYFFAPINMFDILVNYDMNFSLLGGGLLFGGLITPVILFINRFTSLSMPLALAELNKTTSTFVWISDSIHMNNNCTYIYGALRDLGIIGIVVYSIIWAKIMNKSYNLYKKDNSVLNESIYIYTLIISIFLLFEWMPARTNIVYAYIFMYIFNRISSIKIKFRFR